MSALGEQLVAERYSKAVLELLEEQDDSLVLSDVKNLIAIFDENEDLELELNSLLLEKSKKEEILHLIVEHLNFKDTWFNLFHLILEKQRIMYSYPILLEIEKRALAKSNTIKVSIRIAEKISDNVMNQVKKLIEKKLNKNVILYPIIDKEIIGGFVAFTDSFRIDGSIQGSLIKFCETINK